MFYFLWIDVDRVTNNFKENTLSDRNLPIRWIVQTGFVGVYILIKYHQTEQESCLVSERTIQILSHSDVEVPTHRRPLHQRLM